MLLFHIHFLAKERKRPTSEQLTKERFKKSLTKEKGIFSSLSNKERITISKKAYHINFSF